MRVVWVGLLGCVLGCNQHDVNGGSAFGDGEGGEGGSPTATEADDAADATDSAATDGADSEAGADDPTATGSGAATGEADADADADAEADADADGTDASGGSGSTAGSDGSDDAGTDGGGPDDGGPVGTDACGYPLDGPWLQIEYSQAGASSTSPSWSYSDTPGWGESEWAAQNESWPEVWDLYQNIDVDNDPIGVVATVGSSGSWQLMLGFQDLVSYDYATVCVEGRSVSATASVIFDAYNPLTGLGGSATMAHDWQVHAEGVDLGSPFNPGGGVQAVRIVTTGGSSALGIKRMRLILHGAVY